MKNEGGVVRPAAPARDGPPETVIPLEQLTQDAVFSEGESDRYWRRNREHVRDLQARADIPMTLISLYDLRPETALEIGAANGYRLGWLHERYGTRCTAVEPSTEAIEAGQMAHPEIRYLRSTAACLNLDERFDLVVVNYVLHWVDRTRLLDSVSSIDRAVKDGGHLLIGDFAPANRHRIAYHHVDGIWTYKQDYARLFLETGLYHAVAMLSSGHAASELETDVPEQERYACWLLQKRTQDHYIDGGWK